MGVPTFPPPWEACDADGIRLSGGSSHFPPLPVCPTKENLMSFAVKTRPVGLLSDSSRGSRTSRIASAGRAFRSLLGHEIDDSDPLPLLFWRRRERCSSAKHVMRVMHHHKRD